MKQNLINQVFDIQRQIDAVLPDADDCDWIDSGMFVDPKRGDKINVLWRDTSYGIDGKEYAFTWSTAGGFKGELPEKELAAVLAILEPLKKKAPFIEVSNVDEV